MNAKTLTSALIAAVVGFSLGLPGIALADRDDRGHRQAYSQHDGHKSRHQKRDFKRERRHDRRSHDRDSGGHKRQKSWYDTKRNRDADLHRGTHRRGDTRHDAKRNKHRFKGDHDRGYRRYGKHDYDRRYNERRKSHTKRHYRQYNRHHDKRIYKHRNKHHYGRRYGHDYGYGGYGSRYYRDDDDDEKLLLGLVVGGVLGYALNEGTHDNYDDTEEDYFRDNSYSAKGGSAHNDATCLQEREYQTTIMVGGNEADAYGTACLQPDGSWKRGPAQVASY